MAASQEGRAFVNAALLGRIRPGSSLADLKAAIGDAWRDPAPHRGGEVDILENSHGFKAQLDVDGVVGSVDYDHRFPRDAGIDGLRMGMTLANAAAALPDLVIGPDDPMMPGVRYGTRRLPDGSWFEAKFTLETLNGVMAGNPKYVYPAKFSPAYPPVAGLPGAPFEDVNLKLAVLSALLDAKEIDLGEPSQLAEHVLHRKFDIEAEGYELIPQVLDYLARYPLDEALLSRVGTLSFDGGNTIHSFAWPFWDGEDETFDVRSLAGIEQCPNVNQFEVISMVDSVDLEQLLRLRDLRKVKVSVAVTNLAALLEMPKLEAVEFMGDDIYADVMDEGGAARRVMEALKRRGVKVWVHWMSHSGPGRPPAYR